MNPTLEVIDPAGAVARTPLELPRTAIDAAPGHIYRIAAGEAGLAPKVTRVDGDLVVVGLPAERELVIVDFFTACRPDDVCTLQLTDFPGMVDTSITPATLPLAALSDGTFLLFAAAGANGTSGTVIPATPARTEAASAEAVAGTDEPATGLATNWKPWLAVGGGVLVAGAAFSGGGGGDASSVGSDPIAPAPAPTPVPGSPRPVVPPSPVPGGDILPPVAPVITVAGNPVLANGINRAEAAAGFTLQGAGAEPGSIITLTLTGPGAYSQVVTTTANPAGAWQAPFPAGTLPMADGSYQLFAIATDIAGNASTAATTTIVVDVTPPTAIAAFTAGTDNAPPGPAPVPVGIGANDPRITDGGITNDNSPTLVGAVVQPLAAGDTLEVQRNGAAVGTATVAANNRFTFTDSAVPDGAADYTVVARDAAGNVGAPGDSFVFTIDTTPPAANGSVAAVISNVRGAVGIVADGGATTDTTPTIVIRSVDVLAPGETLLVLRTTNGITTVVADYDANEVARAPLDFNDRVAVGNSAAYSTQVIDAAGNLGLASAAYSITIVATPDPTP